MTHKHDFCEVELTEREKLIVDIAVKKANRKIGRELQRESRDFTLGGVFGDLEYRVKHGDLVTFSEDDLRNANLIP